MAQCLLLEDLQLSVLPSSFHSGLAFSEVAVCGVAFMIWVSLIMSPFSQLLTSLGLTGFLAVLC